MHAACSGRRDEDIESLPVVLEPKVRADDDKGGLGRVVALVEGERFDHILEPLVRDDPAHGQHDRFAGRLPPRHLRGQLQQERDHHRLTQSRFTQVDRIEPRHGHQRLDAPLEDGQRGPPAVAEIGGGRAEVPQEVAGRDVVVVEGDGSLRLQRGLHGLAPDCVVQDHATLAQEALAASIERKCRAIEVRVDVLGEDLALVAPPAQQLAPGEGLIRDRVVGRGRWQDLVDCRHLAECSGVLVILGLLASSQSNRVVRMHEHETYGSAKCSELSSYNVIFVG